MPQPSKSPPSQSHQTKLCATCGRKIEWRKKWERDWHTVRFCSDGCRHHKSDGQDAALERMILQLLSARARDKTICPSEAARAVAGDAPDLWQPLMERARSAARRLVAAGRIVITQKGRVVDGSTARGPIRLRLI